MRETTGGKNLPISLGPGKGRDSNCVSATDTQKNALCWFALPREIMAELRETGPRLDSRFDKITMPSMWCINRKS
jgi:hypothetical protein